MSHFTRIKTQIVELEYLKRALADLKYEYEEGNKVRGFGGQRTEADLVVKTKGYPIGFKKRGEAYEVVADWWGVRGVNQKTFVQEVTQRYAYHAVCDKLQAQGFEMVSEQVERGGQVHLVLRQMA
ncbi:MAG TPA: DUF1257 domain-containing protein [Anaerolineae bacterium]|nr:DUF1257 domain-containing protein [Anaerolineae bacterium]